MSTFFRISNFRPIENKNTLRGFFDLRFTPPGMTTRDWSVHEAGEARWISPPGAAQLNPDGTVKLNSKGKREYKQIIGEFDDETWRRLSNAVLAEIEARYPEAFGCWRDR